MTTAAHDRPAIDFPLRRGLAATPGTLDGRVVEVMTGGQVRVECRGSSLVARVAGGGTWTVGDQVHVFDARPGETWVIPRSGTAYESEGRVRLADLAGVAPANALLALAGLAGGGGAYLPCQVVSVTGSTAVVRSPGGVDATLPVEWAGVPSTVEPGPGLIRVEPSGRRHVIGAAVGAVDPAGKIWRALREVIAYVAIDVWTVAVDPFPDEDCLSNGNWDGILFYTQSTKRVSYFPEEWAQAIFLHVLIYGPGVPFDTSQLVHEFQNVTEELSERRPAEVTSPTWIEPETETVTIPETYSAPFFFACPDFQFTASDPGYMGFPTLRIAAGESGHGRVNIGSTISSEDHPIIAPVHYPLYSAAAWGEMMYALPSSSPSTEDRTGKYVVCRLDLIYRSQQPGICDWPCFVWSRYLQAGLIGESWNLDVADYEGPTPPPQQGPYPETMSSSPGGPPNAGPYEQGPATSYWLGWMSAFYIVLSFDSISSSIGGINYYNMGCVGIFPAKKGCLVPYTSATFYDDTIGWYQVWRYVGHGAWGGASSSESIQFPSVPGVGQTEFDAIHDWDTGETSYDGNSPPETWTSASFLSQIFAGLSPWGIYGPTSPPPILASGATKSIELINITPDPQPQPEPGHY